MKTDRNLISYVRACLTLAADQCNLKRIACYTQANGAKLWGVRVTNRELEEMHKHLKHVLALGFVLKHVEGDGPHPACLYMLAEHSPMGHLTSKQERAERWAAKVAREVVHAAAFTRPVNESLDPDQLRLYADNVDTYHIGQPIAEIRASLPSLELLARAARFACHSKTPAGFPPLTPHELRELLDLAEMIDDVDEGSTHSFIL